MRPDEFRKNTALKPVATSRRAGPFAAGERLGARRPAAPAQCRYPHDWEDWEHASERFGIDVETSEDPDDPTRPHPELISKEDDQPRVIDWIMTRLRRLRRRITGR